MIQEREFDEVVASLERKEGCKIRGSFYKHFAMNNFYVALGNPLYVSQLMMERQGKAFDMSHTIKNLVLGDALNHQYYEQ